MAVFEASAAEWRTSNRSDPRRSDGSGAGGHRESRPRHIYLNMIGRRPVHDRSILDALETIDPEPFAGEVWRVTRKGREALRGSTANGRWSPSGGNSRSSTQAWSATARSRRSDIGSRWNRSGRA